MFYVYCYVFFIRQPFSVKPVYLYERALNYFEECMMQIKKYFQVWEFYFLKPNFIEELLKRVDLSHL